MVTVIATAIDSVVVPSPARTVTSACKMPILAKALAAEAFEGVKILYAWPPAPGKRECLTFS